MEAIQRGRFSAEYAQFLADRFYRRYNATIKIKTQCCECNSTIVIPAKDSEKTYETSMCCSCSFDNIKLF